MFLLIIQGIKRSFVCASSGNSCRIIRIYIWRLNKWMANYVRKKAHTYICRNRSRGALQIPQIFLQWIRTESMIWWNFDTIFWCWIYRFYVPNLGSLYETYASPFHVLHLIALFNLKMQIKFLNGEISGNAYLLLPLGRLTKSLVNAFFAFVSL